MRHSYIKRDFASGNPIANVLVVIAGALVIGVSIVLGFFAFIALAAIVLVSAAVIGIRVWWFNRKLGLGPTSAPGAPGGESPNSSDVIEGEYRVVVEERDEA